MDASALLALLDRFFSLELDQDAAIEILGDVSRARPDVLVLEPRDPEVGRAHLELFDDELTGLVIGFNEPLELPRGELRERYGQPTEGVRLKRDEPTPYEYGFSKAGINCTLVVTGDGASDAIPARVIIARRVTLQA